MKKSNLLVVLLIFMLVIGTFTGCGGSTSTSSSDEGDKDPIVIGTLLPRTGTTAVFGNAIWNGFEVARQMVNDRGGIDGRMIEFVDADAPDPAAGATEAERLINQEKVKVIMGTNQSGVALAAIPVAERNNVVYWETTAITDQITESGYTHVFRTYEKGSSRGVAAIEAINNSIASMIGKETAEVTVAIATEDSPYGMVQGDAAEATAEKYGIKIVARESYPSTATDLSSCIMNLKAANADVLFAVGYVNDTNLFWTTARQYGLKFKAVIGGGSGYTDQTFYQTQGDFINGIMDVDGVTGIELDMYKTDKVRKDTEEFRTRYLELTGDETVNFAAEIGFTGAWILLDTILRETNGSLDDKELIDAAHAVEIEETTMGWGVKFDEKGQNIKAASGLYQWQDGKVKLVLPREVSSVEITGIPLKNDY